MKKSSAAINSSASSVCANSSCSKCVQLSKTVSDRNQENVKAQNRDCKNRPTHVTTQVPRPRERPLSTSNVNPRSHQRRWSADFCKCATSPTFTVKKNLKEPEPPQRGVSLLRPHAASHHSSKRYSCPPFAVSFKSGSSSSSASSTTSSCSSPPPVQTSVITGHDPLGWKLRPKSSSTSPRANRLSLQIPLPVILHESSPAPKSVNAAYPDPSLKTKPPLRPKPPRRRHSDSSAFLRSLATPLPVVTLEELRAVHLHSVPPLDESDDVFSGGEEEQVKVTRKIPPPVPEKTSMARQIAQLIACSYKHCGPVTAREELIYSRVIKTKPSHQTEDQSSRNARKTAGLRVDTSCDRERSTPRFPG